MNRAYLPDFNDCDFARNLQDVDRLASVVLSDDWLLHFKHASVEDSVIQVLGESFGVAGPKGRWMCLHESIHAYFNLCD